MGQKPIPNCVSMDPIKASLDGEFEPSTAAYVDSLDNVFWEALLVPLSENLLNASENQRESGFRSMNRHTVIHGEYVDYCTERNSLNAILLLNQSAQYLAVSQEDKRGEEGSSLEGR